MLDTLKGELKVFTKEVEKADGSKRVIFNTCVGATKTDDGYINYYMPINWSTEVKKQVAKVYKQESFDVLVKEAWIKAYRDKDGHTMPILFVNKATIVSSDEDNKPAKKSKATKQKAKANEDLEPIDDDDLPF